MRYAAKRSYTLDADLAYSVGLMTSDGCLQKDGRHVDLTSVDIEQLENFAKALGRTFTISRKKSGKGGSAMRIQFSDVAYYDFLIAIGLTPAKSKTITALAIPDTFYADFLRGLFDGDGTTYAYTDKRWRSSYMFYTGFTSASRTFLEYIRVMNSKLIGTTPGSVHVGSRAYNLYYAKADSRKIKQFMYYDDAVICLARKKEKLEGFIQRDQAGIIL